MPLAFRIKHKFLSQAHGTPMEGCPPDLLPKNLLQRAQPTESLSGHSCGRTTAPMLSHVYSRLPPRQGLSTVAPGLSCPAWCKPLLTGSLYLGTANQPCQGLPGLSSAWGFQPIPPPLFLFMQNLHHNRKALLASSCFLFLSPSRCFSQQISCTYHPTLASASQKTPLDTTVMGRLI